MREKKEGLSVFPTSTMPSGHVVWGIFLVYFSYRVHRRLVLFTVPLVLFSTLGTILFAQHYVVDIFAGIGVGMLSIFIARYFSAKETSYTRQQTANAYS